ncbi:GNAT family N-acetyltransferase [Hymenobacter chitinivorans]|uniref:dTDP-4-amino-4,6-dideoxy-D-galactose acyltransferase n=1 Tax=Hymenobacter chitinivorans DSM 11115 TaxID=1121954 RepID=A0A2M9BM44_9BACT|nr:GNAT family N-acetyltransferase [Hymenobacter chitinivorans]PJJ58995.1 dTDP-4-amino-4,6-dideoxy-D-galactose acyltransferase [Hymenobacter chitinivorans DSM 11115]
MKTAVERNIALEVLPWDTDLLGFSVAQLQPSSSARSCVASLLDEARRQQIQLLYWFVDPADAEAVVTARTLGARLADRKITYSMPMPATAPPLVSNVEPIRTLTPQLRSLALQSGYYSRFRTDPGFAPGVYERLYTHWIENSLAGTLAREVLVYRPTPEAQEVGLLTLRTYPSHVNIDLLAVDEKFRRRAVGATLIEAAQRCTLQWGFSELQVVTQQDNVQACRFYERCGFEPVLLQYIYHIWIK